MDYWALYTILELREPEERERTETEKVIFVQIKCTKDNWYFLSTKIEKMESCKATTNRDTYNINYSNLNATITCLNPWRMVLFKNLYHEWNGECGLPYFLFWKTENGGVKVFEHVCFFCFFHLPLHHYFISVILCFHA